MRQNLNKTTVADTIAERVNRLQYTAIPQWGKMSATQMLRHCNYAMLATLKGKSSGRRSTIRQRILKFVVLNVVSKYPKNVTAPKMLQMTTPIPENAFEQEKREFIDLVYRFSSCQSQIETMHPVFGNLNTKQWGYVTWMHLDHHLRQFGV